MTTLSLSASSDDYEAARSAFAADLATIEQNTYGVQGAAVRAAALRIHARLRYWGDMVDAQNGIPRPMDGTDKPPPHP